MNEEVELENQVKRGQEAEKVLSNEVYQHAFLQIKADLLSRFEHTKHSESNEREKIWLELKAVNELETKLTETMRSGRLARNRLADLISNAKFWK